MWCIQVRLVAVRQSISPYSGWPIHRHNDKMKSFESNLQDNRLLLCPEVDQWINVGPGRLGERHFPSSSPKDGATCSSIMETSTVQCSPRASISVSDKSVLHPFSLLHAASLCRTARIDGKCIKEGHPLP